jgi:hypothetical protein
VRFTSILLLVSATATFAAPVDYAREVKPLLQERCFACHGSLKQNAKLRLDSGELIRKGGSSGAIVVPGKSAESIFIERISDPDEHSRMPPEGQPLTAEQINMLKSWIDEGAKFPETDKPEPDPRDHWAFRPPVRPAIPKADPPLSRNAIDSFLSAERNKRQLPTVGFASKPLLLRRVYLDLLGLPPTQDQINAFLKDTSADAYEKVVNQLLESPQYGERWGRHFMDIWRYSDWWGLGAEVRNSQKHIWHWRDWIIESLNADKGYDQMIREMLAADELYPTDTNKLRAGGYLARQYFIFNRTTWMDETVEHTAKAFLGLTMNCTKCHDHKYDPISHADYYKFRAFFEPYQVRTDMVPGESDFEKNGIPRAFDCNLDAVTYRHQRGDDRSPITSTKIQPGLPAVLGGELKIEPVSLPPEAHSPHLRPWVEDSYVKAAQARIASAREALSKAKAALHEAEKVDRSAPQTESKAKDVAGKLLAKDDFAKMNGDLWEIGPGKWKYEKGVLSQTLPDVERSRIRLKTKPPADFIATLKFTWTGGEPWRSIGLSFDVLGENEVLIYGSAYPSGPKLQIAYKQSADYTYPPTGSMNRSFKVGDTVEMSIHVRGALVNVGIDGEHALAYRLPIERVEGAIELITFAATADFRAFELTELPATYKLVEPKAAPKAKSAIAKPANPEQARLAVAIAEKSLAQAEADLAAIRARFAAERAKHAKPRAADAGELAKAAAKAEKQIALLKAEEDLAKAELELSQAATPQKATAEKKRNAAKAAVVAATKAIENPGETYTIPRGSRKTKESNLETEPSLSKLFPTTSTGRRSALAKWITDRQNPLAARVIVNHLWARHFGKPLVATVFDFGRKGATPTHPELLDWLAVELMENNWSMKHMHRLMVTSDAYRLSSSTAGMDKAKTIDEANVYYWRMNPMRMEAQTVRDSMLHLAGRLDLTQGGPSIPVNAESNRRSLYFVHSHNDHQKFLMQFDDAAVLECYRRTESIVPQQALTLANSKFTLAMANAIGARIATPQAADEEYVRSAFQFILGTTPTADELQVCLDAIAEWRKILKEQKHANPESRPMASRTSRRRPRASSGSS